MLTALLVVSLGATEPMGRVVIAEGEVTVRSDGGDAWTPVERGATLHVGDTIKTAAEARTRLLMNNRSVVDLGSRSELRLNFIEGPAEKRRVGLRAMIGRLWARVAGGGGEERFEIETTSAVAGVRGTAFFMDVDEVGKTEVTVSAGTVAMRGSEGEPFLLERNQRATLGKGIRSIEREIDPALIGALRAKISPRMKLGAGKRGQRLSRLKARLGKGGGKRLKRALGKKVAASLRQKLRGGADGRLRLKIDPAVARRLLERLRRRNQ